MASAGNDNSRPPQQPAASQARHVIRIPLPRGIQPGQRITIRYAQPVPGGPGGQRQQIRVIQLPIRPQQPGGGGGGDVSQALREQEEAARRAAEENHRRREQQLRTALSAVQPPLVEYSEDEGVVRVSWQPVEVPGGDSAEYIVKAWKDGGGDPSIIYQGQLTSTSCAVTTETLCRGHTHQIAVSASASGETGEPSQRVEVTVPAITPDQPPPPKIVSRTKNSLGLRWNAPAANGSPITEYSLEWDQSNGDYKEVYSGKKKEFKFSQKLLPPGSQNLFRVRARNAVGWSEFSEDTVHSVGQATPPAPHPPSLSSLTAHTLTLHWTTPPGSGAVSSYCLEMDDPNSGYGFCPVYQGDGLSYTCRNLQRVTVYNFRLSALNEAGSSPPSPPVSFTTLPETPGFPGDICLGSRPSSTSLSLEWSPPANDGGNPVESYILQVDNGEGGELRDVYKGSEVNFQLDSLSPGRSYRCRVCAVSSGGQGSWSNEATFKTPPTLPRPAINVGVLGKVTVSSAVTSWSRPTSDGGSVITSYNVQLCESSRDWETVATVAEQLSFSAPPTRPSSLSHTLTHLTPGTLYTVRVNCSNAVGTSDWSDSTSFTTAPGPPSPPDNISLSSLTAHSAKLQWKASVEYGSEVSGYEVEWGPVGGASHVMPLPQSPCEASLTHLSPNSSHTARVKAVSDAGHSEWSSSFSFTTSPSTPSPPSHLALVSATPNSILVAWSVPPSPGSPLSQYHIHLHPLAPPTPDSSHLVLPPSETQVTLQNLQPNTQYTVRVQAENRVGLGQLSAPLVASTLPPPPPPPSLSLVSCTHTSLRVTWGKKVNKSISYTLQLATDSGRFHTAYTGTGVSHKHQRLSPATNYSLRISATSESGQGVWSDLLTCETLPVGPSHPVDLVMQREGDVMMMSWKEVSHSLAVTYELQLKIGGQDFTQVYRGSAPSHTHTITNHTIHTARVRACASCHVNDRTEQLFSGFSATATYDCSPPSPPPTDTHTPSSPNTTANNTMETTGAPQEIKSSWFLQHWLQILFVGVSALIIVIAILLGKLFVSSQK